MKTKTILSAGALVIALGAGEFLAAGVPSFASGTATPTKPAPDAALSAAKQQAAKNAPQPADEAQHLAAVLGIPLSQATSVLAQIQSMSDRDLGESNPQFARIAASLHLSPAQLTADLTRFKSSLRPAGPLPSPADKTPAPST